MAVIKYTIAVASVWFALWSVTFPAAHAADKQCLAIKNHTAKIQEIAVYTFGDERDGKLREAQNKLREEFKQINFTVPEELAQLLASFENATLLGHDRLRKGDTRLLQKASEITEQIKRKCPWD